MSGPFSFRDVAFVAASASAPLEPISIEAGMSLGGLGMTASLSDPPEPADPTENLIAWWDLEETSGDRIDSHVNAFPLAVQGGVGQMTGKVGTALRILGTDTCVRSNDPAFNLADTSFYFAHWFFPRLLVAPGSPAPGPYAGRYELASGSRFFEFCDRRNVADTANVVAFQFSTTGSNNIVLRDTTPLVLNAWFFVEVFYDLASDVVGIAVNNSEFTTMVAGGMFSDSPAPFRIGSRTTVGAISVDAGIDSFAIYTAVPSDLAPSGSLRQTLWNNGGGIAYPG